MSRETAAIVAYLEDSGLPCRVTAVLGTWKSAADPCSPHSPGSFHCVEGTDGKGLAVDFGGAQPGTSLQSLEEMGAVWLALMKVSDRLAELIHQGPGITTAVKNGRVVDGLKAFGAATWAAHRNHVHVAVPKGVFLAWPKPPPAAIPVYDFEEVAVQSTSMHIGPLDANGCGWSDWNPGLGRPPNIVAIVQQGPSPPDDGYWMGQSKVNVSAQARGEAIRVTVRNGTPGDTVIGFVTVS